MINNLKPAFQNLCTYNESVNELKKKRNIYFHDKNEHLNVQLLLFLKFVFV